MLAARQKGRGSGARGTARGMSSSHPHPTEAGPRLFTEVTLSYTARSSAVPPAGFEPALPPPETGRPRDRGRLLAPYRAFCSRLLSLAASGVLWFVPRAIPRRVSS